VGLMEKEPISINVKLDISKVKFGGIKVENNGIEIFTIHESFNTLSKEERLKVFHLFEELADLGRKAINGSY
jgi:hypothetical protein